ncbi:MAG: lipoprotein signal peptidase [Bacteroidales bacterium]|jgi:signal peptidase II|nr:lipoprotein signal peptidase [Bacteroidales bacterium]
MTKLQKALLVILPLLVADQALKIWIKTHMMLGEDFSVFGNWFLIHFVENNGMALGLEFGGGAFGKIFLSLFRIVAVAAIGWYLVRLSRREDIPAGFVICVALIFTGAVGNIIDSAFYGLIFTESWGQIATIFPEQGYASFLHGKVVDMLYFPLIEGHYPAWFPLIGGDEFLFFRPVFNIADSCITVGILSIICFYWTTFSKLEFTKSEKTN